MVTEDLPDAMEDAVNEVGVALLKSFTESISPVSFHQSLKHTSRLYPKPMNLQEEARMARETGLPVR